jgi:ribose transport system permease protein
MSTETAATSESVTRPRRAGAWRAAFAFDKTGALYVWAAIIIIFAIWIPGIFLTWDTVRQVLNSSAIGGIAALALVVPLATRTFDLSIGMVMTLSGVTTAHFLQTGMAPVPAIVIGLAVALGVGVVNGIVVVVMAVDSFIATLATGSLIQAFTIMATNNQQITDSSLGGSFAKLAQGSVGNITLPVIYLAVLAIILWLLLEHTPTGRRMYATGFNEEAARLVRIRTNRLRFASLLVSATIAGAAGILLTSQTGAGTPDSGSPYLLSAFAAAFLGATQIHAGRFNAWGTVIAVLLLGTGVTGLGLAGTPQWAPSMFTGAVLIVALVVTGAEWRRARSGSQLITALVGRLRRGRSPTPVAP